MIDKRNVIKAINYLILRLSDTFNVGKKFTDEQAAMMSVDLFEVFKYETLEDVTLMFKMVRQGRIGDGKDFKLDSQTVFHKWVPEYLELKAIERENQHRKRMGEKNGVTSFQWTSEDIKKLEVSEEKTMKVPPLGERVKEKMKEGLINETEKPFLPIKSRKEFLQDMFYEVRKQKTEDLRKYLIKTNKNSTGFDQDIFDLVQKELDRRMQTKTQN